MNKKTAILCLKQQKIKLLDQQLYKDENWVFQTGSYVKDFFGEHSTEYIFIKQFSFSLPYNPFLNNNEIVATLEKKESMALVFINNCIETLEHKGIYQAKGANFMSLWSFKNVIGFLILIFFIGIIAGTILGFHRLTKVLPFLSFLSRLT